MRDLIIHIGRHKSGTTAIQKFLTGNLAALHERGIYVPRAGLQGPGHHDLSQPMQRAEIERSGIADASGIEAVARFREEIAALEGDAAVVISSEAFQNCDPRFVKKAFDGYRVHIVVYIRNQLEYLASAYAQRVHATAYSESLEEYFQTSYASNYFRFLNNWCESFPHDMVVRRYQRDSLEGGDVIRDFIVHALGLGDEDGLDPASGGQANPSLNARVLQFKLDLNRRGLYEGRAVHVIYRYLPQMNELFPAPALRLTQGLKARLVEECYDSDCAVAERYFGEAELFDYTAYQTADVVELKPDELDSMYGALEKEMRAAGLSLYPTGQAKP